MDCESVDMYPVGWCELVGHRLEGPRMKMPIKKERKRKQNPKKAVGKARKKGTGASPGDNEVGSFEYFIKSNISIYRKLPKHHLEEFGLTIILATDFVGE